MLNDKKGVLLVSIRSEEFETKTGKNNWDMIFSEKKEILVPGGREIGSSQGGGEWNPPANFLGPKIFTTFPHPNT